MQVDFISMNVGKTATDKNTLRKLESDATELWKFQFPRHFPFHEIDQQKIKIKLGCEPGDIAGRFETSDGSR
eukprot:UN07453